MEGKVLNAILIFGICIFSKYRAVSSTTCEESENKIKSYENEIESLKVAVEEFSLIIPTREHYPDECDEFKTCSSCLRENKNAVCGWCVLRHICITEKNCPKNKISKNFWITESYRCPKIKEVAPHNIPASTSKELQVFIPYVPDFEAKTFYICAFEVLGKTLVSKATRFEQGFTCSSPRSDRLPKMAAGDDHVVAKLSLRTPNGVNFVSTSNFTIYDCSRYKTCSECSASDFPCAWCVGSQRCSDDASEHCMNDIIVSSKSVTEATTQQGPGYCPRIAPNTESEKEILIPSGSRKKISVKVENVGIFQSPPRFTCKVRGFPVVEGQISGDTLDCDGINLRLSGRQPIYNLSFSVYWNREGQLDNPRNLRVIVYHCERMAKNCGQCLNLPDRYNCGWCEEIDSCTTRDYCANSLWMDDKSTCKRPEITSIHPSSGVYNVYTNLTIEGVNLAKEFSDIESISVIDERRNVLGTCLPFENLHVKHSKIVCSLDTPHTPLGTNGRLIGFIEVKFSKDFVAISEKEYTFVDPVIDSFHPARGMESGGTILKITGQYLDAGNDVKVYIGDIPCRVISRDATNIKCISSPIIALRRAPKRGLVRVLFDGAERPSSTYFSYVADPSIQSVKGEYGSHSPAGTPRGGDLILVEGSNFGYVPNPYMYVIANGMEYVGACTVLSETSMECVSPAIPTEVLNFCEGDGYLPLHYGFKLGDAEGVQNISKNAKFEMFKLYPGPYLLPFSEEGRVKNYESDYLIIQGKYLDNLFNENDYRVTVGGEECSITSLSQTQLTCKLPHLTEDDHEETKLPQVQVKIRGSFEYFIGFFRVEQD